jgi:hypothetical protein
LWTFGTLHPAYVGLCVPNEGWGVLFETVST